MRYEGLDGARIRTLEVSRRESGYVCRLGDGSGTWWGPFQTVGDAHLYASRKLGRSKSWPIKWVLVEEEA